VNEKIVITAAMANGSLHAKRDFHHKGTFAFSSFEKRAPL
jgi:hypothetical protein